MRRPSVSGAAVLLLALSLTHPGQAIPPPPEQAAVDCSARVYAIDGLICDDPELRASEGEMRTLLGQISSEAMDGQWIESQPDWIRRRALCASRPEAKSCVASALSERIATLRSLSDASPRPIAALWRCKGAAWASSIGIERGREAVALRDTTGKVQAVAFAQSGPAWRPFVLIKSVREKQIDLRSGSTKLSCRR